MKLHLLLFHGVRLYERPIHCAKYNVCSKIFGSDLRPPEKKLEEQVASFLLTQGASDDLLEDLIPKPINSEQEFDRFGTEHQEKVYRRKMVRPVACKIVHRFIIMLLKSWHIICTIQGTGRVAKQ
jgi:hypothetical protein